MQSHVCLPSKLHSNSIFLFLKRGTEFEPIAQPQELKHQLYDLRTPGSSLSFQGLPEEGTGPQAILEVFPTQAASQALTTKATTEVTKPAGKEKKKKKKLF